MTLTVLRKSVKKLQTIIINYRPQKNFLNGKFKIELRKEDFINNVKDFERFCNISMKVLNKHAQWKKKFARRNQMCFMTRDLSTEKMKRPRMRKRFLKNKSLENRMLYTQQKSYCASR